MAYDMSDDEKYFLSQFVIMIESNQSVTEVPYVWMPDHFDTDSFRAAYYKFCSTVCPEFRPPRFAYERSIHFTEAQISSINGWTDWIQSLYKPRAVALIQSELDRKAHNQYYDAVKKKLGDLKLEKRKREQEKEVLAVPAEDRWGRVKKSKIQDDGNSWREQK